MVIGIKESNLDNAFGFTRSIVVIGGLTVTEDLQSRESRDSELVASSLLSCAVHLDESNWWVVVSQLGSGLFVFRS